VTPHGGKSGVKSPFQSRADKWAWIAFGLTVLVACLGVAHRVAVSPKGRVIVQDADAPWIMAQRPFSAAIRQHGRSEPLVTEFSRAFELPSATSGRLEIRVFGQPTLWLNDRRLTLDESGADWKRRQSIELDPWLRAGRNTLRVRVEQKHGPALLSLRLDAGGRTLRSDEAWRARSGSWPERAARLASDIQQHPDARRFRRPAEAMAQSAAPLVGLFALLCGVFWALPRWRGGARPGFALAALGGAWLYLFVAKFLPMATHYGFDATKHIAYVDLLRSSERLPLATDGWSTYHPPLYHGLAAVGVSLGQFFGEGGALFMQKAPSLGAGFGLVWLSHRLARRLFPDEAGSALWAAAFAACLPMNLYMAAYVSNEGLAAFLTALALVTGVETLLKPRVEASDLFLVSSWLGLALLTKYTALVLGVPILVFVGVRGLVSARCEGCEEGRASLGRALGRTLAPLLLPMLGIAGWFYLRNAWLFHDPLIGNWNLPGDERIWWSPPGFHTFEYYLSFGEALVRPYYAAFASFWDALYSTLWGDGQLAGKITGDDRNPQWHYGWMTVGYALALPVSGVMGVGWGRLLLGALRDPRGRQRSALALLLVCGGALGFALFYLTLSLPFYGQAKAFYALSLTPLLALIFARGASDLTGWIARGSLGSGRSGGEARPLGRVLAIALQAILATALVVFFLGFAA